VTDVEQLTRGQRSNPLWSSFRAGRLTASKFGDVLRACRRNSIPPSLLASLLSEYNTDGVKAIQWGVEHEQTAIDEYKSAFGVNVSLVGMILHSSGVLAASPDGIVDQDIVEFKCPMSQAQHTIPEALEDKKFYALDDAGSYVLKPSHVYYDQCQGQLHITGKKRVEFYVWLPKGSLKVTVLRDEEWGKPNIPLLLSFYYSHLLPAYINKCNACK